MLFLLLKKGRKTFLMHLYCIIIVILYCSLKEAFLCKNIQLGPRKSVRCKEVSATNCPLDRGFLIRILYETNPFLTKVSAGRRCPLQRMSAIEKFHCSLHLKNSAMQNKVIHELDLSPHKREFERKLSLFLLSRC